MDLIYIRNTNGSFDNGILHHYEVDFDVTEDVENPTNDFELKMELPDDKSGLLWSENEIVSMIFYEGTEYGGIISGSTIDLEEKTVTYKGRTWRGTLSEYIIEPPAGQDYLTVTGNLADILNSLPISPYMYFADTEYAITASYSFNRYIPTFEGATDLLTFRDSELRLAISFEQLEGAYTGLATVTITPTRDLTDLIEISQDYNDHVKLKITKDSTTPRELICLGAGELAQRQVIHLYADDDWNISTTPITDAHPVEVYEYSGSGDLLADGVKKFKEYIFNYEQIDVDIEDLDVRLGDIIAAKDNLTGEMVTAEITTIVYKCTDYGTYQQDTYEYKTKVRL